MEPIAPMAVQKASATVVPHARRTDLQVLATFHKPFAYDADSTWLRPCGVGGFRLDDPQAWSDDQGEQISALNGSYCELTALYWAWRNLPKEVEHVGLCHYRRYFWLGPTPMPGTRVSIAAGAEDAAMRAMASDAAASRALQLLDYAEAIVPAPYVLGLSIGDHFRRNHPVEHWNTFIDVVRELAPGYRPWLNFLERDNRFTFCNMWIARRALFDRYCAEVFPLAAEWYRRIEMPEDRYQARFVGFLAERFFMLFLHANGVRTAAVPLVPLEPGA